MNYKRHHPEPLPKHPLTANMHKAEYAAFFSAEMQLFAELQKNRIDKGRDIDENNFKVRGAK